MAYVKIPDDLWEWFQTQTGMPKPATPIRNVLQVYRADTLTRAVLKPAAPERPYDKGTVVEALWDGPCFYCKDDITTGDEVVYFTTQHGPLRKKVAHPRCHTAAKP